MCVLLSGDISQLKVYGSSSFTRDGRLPCCSPSPAPELLCCVAREPWHEAAAGGGVTNLTHSDAGEGGKAVNNLREVSQCPEKAPTRVSSLFETPSSAFTNENLLRHYAKQVFEHCK